MLSENGSTNRQTDVTNYRGFEYRAHELIGAAIRVGSRREQHDCRKIHRVLHCIRERKRASPGMAHEHRACDTYVRKCFMQQAPLIRLLRVCIARPPTLAVAW